MDQIESGVLQTLQEILVAGLEKNVAVSCRSFRVETVPAPAGKITARTSWGGPLIVIPGHTYDFGQRETIFGITDTVGETIDLTISSGTIRPIGGAATVSGTITTKAAQPANASSVGTIVNAGTTDVIATASSATGIARCAISLDPTAVGPVYVTTLGTKSGLQIMPGETVWVYTNNSGPTSGYWTESIYNPNVSNVTVYLYTETY